MTFKTEQHIFDFEFWSGAKSNTQLLTEDELYSLDEILESYFEEMEQTPTATEINDLFWFDFEFICELLGLDYDSEKHEINR